MKRVIKITLGQLIILKVDDDELTSEFIKKHIGRSDGTSYFEQTHISFNLPNIKVVCDEEGELKRLPMTLRLKHDIIAGDCIIVAYEKLENEEDGYGWFGITDEQFNFVLSELFFSKKSKNK